MSDPLLTNHDRQSAIWQKLTKHLESRLQLLRTLNDGAHDPVKTAELRGRIKEVKALLALRTDAPATPDEDKLFKD